MIIDETGHTYGKLTVIKRDCCQKGKQKWLCQCSCGNLVVVTGDALRNKGTKSCGCLNREVCSKLFKTHGLSKTRLYHIYYNMKRRCYDKKSPEYSIYGGKGVKICDEWLLSFMIFYKWAINNGYSEYLTLDRIDGNKNYCPENCRWADKKTQAINRRTTIFISDNGISLCLKDYCKKYNFKYKLVQARLKKGLALQDAIK